MINIWKYDVGEKLQILTMKNAVFVGYIEAITDAGERSDLEKQEDSLGIITDDGRHIEIYQSEIKSIERLTSTENIA